VISEVFSKVYKAHQSCGSFISLAKKKQKYKIQKIQK
jgi:hypothetical protein